MLTIARENDGNLVSETVTNALVGHRQGGFDDWRGKEERRDGERERVRERQSNHVRGLKCSDEFLNLLLFEK